MNKPKKPCLNLFYALTFVMVMGSCSYFEQNDFVVSETISNGTNEHIFYNVYQTGIDNYRFEFMTTNSSDRTKLFEYYLNDAVYTAMKFNSSKTGDTLKIKTNFPTKNTVAKTANGTIVILTNE